MQSGFRHGAAKPRQTWLTCALLVIATAAAYWPVRHFQFLNYDDPWIFQENPFVSKGLTWPGIVWGATTCFYEYWHPLMWWSHMLDCQLFGMNAGPHHLVSLGFHLANTALVFLLFRQMTGMLWRSAMVAALFGLHPLHVESVAWLAERKDLLSTFFWLLSVWAYVAYVQRSGPQDPVPDGAGDGGSKPPQENPPAARTGGGRKYYWLSVFLFLLGLMSKPMVVTLPFVLLLLDYWPLGRISDFKFRYSDWIGKGRNGGLAGMIREKWPFFALTGLFCFITWFSVKQGNHVVSSNNLPLAVRLANVPVAYVRYLWNTFYIGHNSVMYVMQRALPAWGVVGAGLMLVAITRLVLEMRNARYLAFGWFFFVGILVPTIGLVPVGWMAMADRYMYLPITGLFAALVWGAADLAARWPGRRLILGVVAAAVLATCGMVTWRQVQYWGDNVSLWSHCVDQNPGSALALSAYADALADANEFSRAIEQYTASLRLDSSDGETYEKSGLIRMRLKDFDGAAADFENAYRLLPPQASDYVTLGTAYAQGGKSDAAKGCFQTAIGMDPACADAHYYLGLEYLKNGLLDKAAPSLEKAVELNSTNAAAHAALGGAWGGLGQPAKAVKEYRAALALDPKLSDAKNNLAWILATSPDSGLRDGAEAVKLANSACEQTSWKQTIMVGTLAAAYAEAGDFERAVQTSEKACELASQRGETNLLHRNQMLLDQYKRRQPAREGD